VLLHRLKRGLRSEIIHVTHAIALADLLDRLARQSGECIRLRREAGDLEHLEQNLGSRVGLERIVVGKVASIMHRFLLGVELLFNAFYLTVNRIMIILWS
jgi:hypothetical protein